MKYVATVNEQRYLVEILDERRVAINGVEMPIDFETIGGQPVFSLLVDGRSHEAHVYPGDEGWQVLMRGRLYSVRVEDEREARLHAMLGEGPAGSGEFHLRAPMPGLVVSVAVEEGQPIEKGQVLVILESMKMQNELKAPRAGTVHRLKVKAGETVEQKQTLLSIA